jgi:uncharacterized protein (TIGR00730 family)
MSNISSICVYCGSRVGNDPGFKLLAEELGTRIAQQQVRLVYGGGQVGLMGIVADAVMQAGGEVIGIIPDFLDKREVGHTNLTELHVVPDMHTRKQMMFDMSDAFVAMPGGIGTLDELMEIMTWRQLSQHNKPIYALDHENYWHKLRDLLEHIVHNDFAGDETTQMIKWPATVDALFAQIDAAPMASGRAHSERI